MIHTVRCLSCTNSYCCPEGGPVLKYGVYNVLYLCGQGGHLLGQHLLLLPRQPRYLIRFYSLGHQLEVSIILKQSPDYILSDISLKLASSLNRNLIRFYQTSA